MIALIALVAACGGGSGILPDGKSSPYSSAKVGDTIQFGGYDWRVLYIQDGKALILSDKILTKSYGDRSSTWEKSRIRQYLNDSFYENTFTADEKEWIVESRIVNNANQWYNTIGGIDTVDKVFLLSLEEVVKYFGDSGGLANIPRSTFYINDQYNSARITTDKDTGSALSWWLRSPGDSYRFAAYVGSDGRVYVNGVDLDYGNVGVRPALWLKL